MLNSFRMTLKSDLSLERHPGHFGALTVTPPGTIVTGVELDVAVAPLSRVAATTPITAPAPATPARVHQRPFLDLASAVVLVLICEMTTLSDLLPLVAVTLILNRPSWSFGM